MLQCPNSDVQSKLVPKSEEDGVVTMDSNTQSQEYHETRHYANIDTTRQYRLSNSINWYRKGSLIKQYWNDKDQLHSIPR